MKPLTKLFLIVAALWPGASLARADEGKAVTDQEIHSTVNSHMSELKACMSKHGASSGKLVVEFAIEKDGHVSMSKVSHASANHPLDECIAGLFRHFTFPKPRNGQMWLSNYPVIFSVPKAAPQGTLTADDIKTTQAAHLPEVQSCLDDAKKEKSDVAGLCELGVVVSPTGTVSDVKVLSSTTQAPKLDACIMAKVKAWKFPKPKGGEAAVRVPFKLNE